MSDESRPELDRQDPDSRLAGLTIREQAELALRLSAKDRLELLLHAPKPMRLVRSLPDSDLYLTVREVGPHDALPLIAMASASQVTHLLDLESWRHDRFDADRCGAWAAFLLEAGEPAFKRFLRAADDETLVLLFMQWMRVAPIEIDHEEPVDGHGETEAGTESGFVSPDGAHRFRPAHAEHASAIRRFAEAFFHDDQPRYFGILRSALREVPSEVEESAYRWRQSRLEEHGFPGFEEALSVYAPPEGITVFPSPLPPEDPDGLMASRAPVRVGAGGALVRDAIDRLGAAERERLLHGLVSVANKVLVADGSDTGDPAAHRGAVEKATSAIVVALESRGVFDPAGAAQVLETVPPIELFREGHARGVDLQARARRIFRSGWGSGHPRAIELLDLPIRKRIAALLEPRPRYLDDADASEGGVRREFRNLREIDETRTAVDFADLVGRVALDHLGVDVADASRPRPDAPPPTFSTLFLTAMARFAVSGERVARPLDAATACEFLRRVASRRTAPPGAPERAMDSLLDSITESGAYGPHEVAALHLFGQACLDRLRAECGGLDPGTPPSPRAVTCLVLEPEAAQ